MAVVYGLQTETEVKMNLRGHKMSNKIESKKTYSIY